MLWVCTVDGCGALPLVPEMPGPPGTWEVFVPVTSPGLASFDATALYFEASRISLAMVPPVASRRFTESSSFLTRASPNASVSFIASCLER